MHDFKMGQQESTGLIDTHNQQANSIMKRERLGDQILMYLRNAFWVILAVFVLYYSNFFHHLFRNPKIQALFFEICMAGYTILVGLIFYTTFFMPFFYGQKSIENHNPRLIPIGAVVGVVSVLSLLIAIWPIWGFTSLLIFLSLWKGFFGLSVFLPSGHVGNLMFIIINTGTVLSFYVIEHQGYLH